MYVNDTYILVIITSEILMGLGSGTTAKHLPHHWDVNSLNPFNITAICGRYSREQN